MTIRKRISLNGGAFDGANALVLDGVAFDIGTRVIKWWEPDGFGQYETNRVVRNVEDMRTGEVKKKIIAGRRYARRKKGIKGIRQILIHHSGADRETPAIMRDVLHNQRGLSVQFAHEDNGLIYQFLDAIEAARHAGNHNQLSIGTECCLFPDAGKRPNYYSPSNRKRTGNLPHKKRVEVIQGMRKEVFCFTDPQVDALARWAAGLWCGLLILGKGRPPQHKGGVSADVPFNIPPTFPRNSKGEIPRKVFKRALEYCGLLGHLHCSPRKWDPAGFPWEEFERLVDRYFWTFTRNYSGRK